jgi:hypothetical protein
LSPARSTTLPADHPQTTSSTAWPGALARVSWVGPSRPPAVLAANEPSPATPWYPSKVVSRWPPGPLKAIWKEPGPTGGAASPHHSARQWPAGEVTAPTCPSGKPAKLAERTTAPPSSTTAASR